MDEQQRADIQIQQEGTKAQAIVGVAPRTFEEGWRFANLIANSELAPKDYIRKPANVLVAIQMGAEIGLPPMAALQNIAVINGRPSLWGDAALAVVQVHPAYEWHKEHFDGAGESKAAVFEVKRKGQDPHVTRFSVADATKAGLWGKDGPWTKYPNRMLQMRARGFGLRDKFSDALRGLSIAEEAMDIPSQVIEASDIPQLPETIQRRSELPTVDEVAAAQAKLDQRRAEEEEPSVKRAENHKTELEPAGVVAQEAVKGLPLEFK